jgi:hypothetical protein
MDFPEGSDVQAPRGFRFSLWSLSSFPSLNASSYKTQANIQN